MEGARPAGPAGAAGTTPRGHAPERPSRLGFVCPGHCVSAKPPRRTGSRKAQVSTPRGARRSPRGGARRPRGHQRCAHRSPSPTPGLGTQALTSLGGAVHFIMKSLPKAMPASREGTRQEPALCSSSHPRPAGQSPVTECSRVGPVCAHDGVHVMVCTCACPCVCTRTHTRAFIISACFLTGSWSFPLQFFRYLYVAKIFLELIFLSLDLTVFLLLCSWSSRTSSFSPYFPI